MHPQTSLITTLFLYLALVSAAVNLAQIVASNEDLAEQSTNADNDVNNVDVLNGLIASQVSFKSPTSLAKKIKQHKLTATTQRQ